MAIPISPRPATVRFLTNQEAAEYLKLSPRTLEKLRVIGGGPRFHKFGRRVRYAQHELEAWADIRACDSTSDAHYLNPR
jgi:excisionase family DNA binding protein